jgi:hypothetical protein
MSSITTAAPTAQHETAYAYGYARTAQMTADLTADQLQAYRDVWRRRLERLPLGTSAYAVALGSWTSLHHRLTNATPSVHVRDRIQRPARRVIRRTRSCTYELAGGTW